jgi:hypothetical protein
MGQLTNNAHTRLRERAFTIWEEAGGNISEGYSLWHKLRPLLSRPEARPPSPRSELSEKRSSAGLSGSSISSRQPK